MMKRAEMNEKMMEQVNGGFECQEKEMMSELCGRADTRVEMPEEIRERFEKFKDVFI